MKRKLPLPLILLLLIVLSISILNSRQNQPKDTTPEITPIQEPTPTPFNPFPYKPPTIAKKRSYITVLVGDSMTEALGVNANPLRLHLISLYPEHEFVNYNYGFGSTNILSLPERLNNQTTYLGQTFPSILTQGFDLIILESFAYNPLSHLPIEEGLKKHEEILDASIKEIIKASPNSVIALMTPIAPNRQTFAKGSVNLNDDQRRQWIEERITYIQKHTEYAKQRNLPLINVYEKSLTPNGDGNPKYINPHDNIHPSTAGLELIAKTTAEFIFQSQIFPN